MLLLEIPGQPVAFARAGSRGGQRFTPPKQRDYGNLIKLAAAAAMKNYGVALEEEAPLLVNIRAEYVAPKSWSAKARAAARWKTTKPDIDNLLKIAKDAMTGIVYRDDAQVASVAGCKVYGSRECLTIEVSRI